MVEKVAAGSVRVLIVSDQELFRSGLSALLAGLRDVVVIGDTREGEDALREVSSLCPDVVLLDLVTPGSRGAGLVASLSSRSPGCRILLVTAITLAKAILPALRAGALGYVSKNASRRELLEGIRQVARFRPHLPAEMSRYALHGGPVIEPLTPREIEVLRLLAQGLSNRKIAEHCRLSSGTVRTHLSHIFDKMHVGNRVEATLYALRDGVISLDEALSEVRLS